MNEVHLLNGKTISARINKQINRERKADHLLSLLLFLLIHSLVSQFVRDRVRQRNSVVLINTTGPIGPTHPAHVRYAQSPSWEKER